MTRKASSQIYVHDHKDEENELIEPFTPVISAKGSFMTMDDTEDHQTLSGQGPYIDQAGCFPSFIMHEKHIMTLVKMIEMIQFFIN